MSELNRLLLVGGLMELGYASFYVVGGEQTMLFIAVNAFVFALLALLIFLPKGPEVERGDSKKTLWIVLGFGILFRLTLVPLDPVGSDDIWRYVWDGKVSAAGLNPYVLAPSDSSLMYLHTADLPSKIGFPNMRTIYPPMAQGFFLVSSLLFGDSIPGMKLLLVLADLAVMILLVALLRKKTMDVGKLVLYAWSPLPVMYFGLDGHLDAVAIPFLLLSLYLVLREKTTPAVLSTALGGLVKLYPLFVVPLLLRPGGGWEKARNLVLLVLVLLAGFWMYYEPTGGIFESLGVYGSSFEFNGALFSLLLWILASNLEAHVVCGVLFVLWLAILFFLDRSFLEKTFLTFAGFVILSPVVHPWYLTWLAALLVLRWSLAVFIFLGLSNLSNIVVFRYHTTGVWRDDPLLMILEYVPFFILLLWEMSSGKPILQDGRRGSP